ncbi:MAG: PEP-CTERM sorting domain-containing protein [Terriglobia bacterium]|jgi:hypothetical protein
MNRSQRTLLLAAILTLGVTLLPSTAKATTIFSDFGSGNPYSCCGGYTIGLGFTQGNSFISGATYDLTQIDVALGYIQGNNPTLSLYADNGSDLPGALIESWSLSGLPRYGTCCAIETVAPVGTVVLTGGAQYWLLASGGTSDWSAWYFNNTGALGQRYINGNGYNNYVTTDTMAAFDVLGKAATPEPGTIILLGSGLTGLIGFARRRLS